MKRLVLITFLVFYVNLTWAQTLSWGLNIAPGVSYRIGQRQNISDYAQSIQLGEESMYVFDFGVDLRKKINNRLSIGTGIIYSQKGFSNTHVAAVYDDPHLSRRYLLDFVQDYLEIPFYLTYLLNQDEQFQFYPLLGLTNSLLLNEKNSVSSTNEEVNEEILERLSNPYLSSAKLHNVGIIGGMGIMGSVDPKTSIGLEAVSKVMLSPLLDQYSNTHRYLYSFNLNFKFVRRIQ